MFSATWPSSIQKLASEFLSHPVKVTIGSQDLSASHSVTQVRLRQPAAPKFGVLQCSAAMSSPAATASLRCPSLQVTEAVVFSQSESDFKIHCPRRLFCLVVLPLRCKLCG